MYLFIDKEKNIRVSKDYSRQRNEIGSITMHQAEDTNYLMMFHIEKDFRGKGYGRDLLAATVITAKVMNPEKTIVIDSSPDEYKSGEYTKSLKRLTNFYFKTLGKYTNELKINPILAGEEVYEYRISGSF